MTVCHISGRLEAVDKSSCPVGTGQDAGKCVGEKGEENKTNMPELGAYRVMPAPDIYMQGFSLEKLNWRLSSPPASWLPLEHHRRNFGVILSLNPTLDWGRGSFSGLWTPVNLLHTSHAFHMPPRFWMQAVSQGKDMPARPSSASCPLGTAERVAWLLWVSILRV